MTYIACTWYIRYVTHNVISCTYMYRMCSTTRARHVMYVHTGISWYPCWTTLEPLLGPVRGIRDKRWGRVGTTSVRGMVSSPDPSFHQYRLETSILLIYARFLLPLLRTIVSSIGWCSSCNLHSNYVFIQMWLCLTPPWVFAHLREVSTGLPLDR